MKDLQYITSSHPAYIESLYQDYIKNPDSIDAEMRKFFDGFDFAVSNTNGGSQATSNAPTPNGKPQTDIDWMKEIRAYRMILGKNKPHPKKKRQGR
jgi:2-oxoglutarate dehydrogenase E1 component